VIEQSVLSGSSDDDSAQRIATVYVDGERYSVVAPAKWKGEAMATQKTVTLDKYARNARRWKESADIAYRAATRLFETRDLLLLFPAATLGHHALEMYLKAALICEGCTIFDPRKLKYLDPSITCEKPTVLGVTIW
jgi:hypothetical protein